MRWMALAFLVLTATPSEAARMWTTAEMIDGSAKLATIHIEGDIVPGDYKQFLDLANDAFARFAAVEVAIESRGGAVGDALRIGEQVRNYFFFTLTRRECASACVFILAGGVDRLVYDGAQVGLHRPRFDAREFAGLTAMEARKRYDEMLAELRRDWNAIGGSDEAMRIMTSTPSETMYWLRDRDEAKRLGLDGRDPAYAEWIRAGKDVRGER